MKLFGIILKLIEALGLHMNSEEKNQLTVDVKDWEDTCVEKSEDKIKQLYWKIHNPIYFRLLSPFLYFWALKTAKDIMSDEEESPFED